MKNDSIKKIRNAIIVHPQNAAMGKKGYKPIFSASTRSRIVLIGQAPGVRAQESRVPWNDKSGEQLRRWLGITDEEFYDTDLFALIPMDFYFPGTGTSGDLPPRKGFADLWHPRLKELMPDVELVILIGQYAQDYYLADKERTLTETVRNYKKYLKDDSLPIPHPSPRNNIWKKKNQWFEKDLVPILQRKVRKTLKESRENVS